MILEPLNNNVILEATPDYKSSIKGMVLTDKQKEEWAIRHQYQTTKVHAVGKKVKWVKPGDLVLFRISSVSRFSIEPDPGEKGEKQKFFLLVEDLLICKVNG